MSITKNLKSFACNFPDRYAVIDSENTFIYRVLRQLVPVSFFKNFLLTMNMIEMEGISNISKNEHPVEFVCRHAIKKRNRIGDSFFIIRKFYRS